MFAKVLSFVTVTLDLGDKLHLKGTSLKKTTTSHPQIKASAEVVNLSVPEEERQLTEAR